MPVRAVGHLRQWVWYWLKRLELDGASAEARAQTVERVNPIYIPRNYKVEEALATAVDQEDMKPFSKLIAVLSHPFEEVAGCGAYAEPTPGKDIHYKIFCGK